MYSSSLFAVEKLNIDPETSNAITGFGLFFMGMILVMGVGFIAWQYVPVLVARSRDKRAEKIRAANNIWFDAKESVLHRGSRQLKIPENTIEFFVCKLVFSEQNKSELDLNVLEEYGGDTFKQRTVYQAVIRLNKKARSELKLKEDLFIRGKDKTSLNNNYR